MEADQNPGGRSYPLLCLARARAGQRKLTWSTRACKLYSTLYFERLHFPSARTNLGNRSLSTESPF